MFAAKCEDQIARLDPLLDDPAFVDRLYNDQPILRDGQPVRRPLKPFLAWYFDDLKFGVGGGLKARLNGAVAADVPEAEGAGGALRQRPARAKSRQDPMGWPRKPVVATITVAEVRLHLSRSAQLCSNLPTQNF